MLLTLLVSMHTHIWWSDPWYEVWKCRACGVNHLRDILMNDFDDHSWSHNWWHSSIFLIQIIIDLMNLMMRFVIQHGWNVVFTVWVDYDENFVRGMRITSDGEGNQHILDILFHILDNVNISSWAGQGNLMFTFGPEYEYTAKHLMNAHKN